jgi:4-amino-4-deoxy-L-arabinose transferase-like glycosyltransferase
MRLLENDFRGDKAPFRIAYPVFVYELAAFHKVFRDPVLAGQIASFVNSLVADALVFGLILFTSQSKLAAMSSGLYFALMPRLIVEGISPLYNSAFTVVTLATICASVSLCRKVSPLGVILTGIFSGLSVATRGQGVAYPFIVCLLLLLINGRQKRQLFACGGVIALAIATNAAAHWPLDQLAKPLPPDQANCLKTVILDGKFYALGSGRRDLAVYSLNNSNTTLTFEDMKPCAIPWGTFIKSNASGMIGTSFRNVCHVLSNDPDLLFPLVLIVVVFGWDSCRHAASDLFWMSIAISAWTLAVAICVQMQPSYLDSVSTAAALFCGFGISNLARRQKGTAALLCIAGGCVPGLLSARALLSEDNSPWRNYKDAALSISRDTERVMSRYHGVAPYLQAETISLPINDPSRVMLYVRYSKVECIVIGPVERGFNPSFAAFAKQFKPIASFGTGEDKVDLYSVTQLSEVSSE